MIIISSIYVDICQINFLIIVVPYLNTLYTDESAPNLYYPSNSIAIKGVLNKGLESLSKVLLDQALGQVIASVWRYPKVIFAELNSKYDVQKLLKVSVCLIFK